MKRLMLILFLCLTIVAFFGCKKGEEAEEAVTTEEVKEKPKSDEELIAEVADKFFDAMKKADANAYKALLDEESAAEFGEEAMKDFSEAMSEFEKLGFYIDGTKVEGESATVDFTVKFIEVGGTEEETDHDSFELVKVGDEWKVLMWD